MAEKNSTSNISTNTFSKGLNKDLNETFVGPDSWSHARNAVNNSHDGQIGVIGNEPSNISCVDLPYTLIGTIPLLAGEFVVFTSDNTNSEIGIFDENKCTYKKVVNSKCLSFNTNNLITGVYRDTFDCGRKIYFDDGINPSRVLNIDNPAYIQRRTRIGECFVETNTSELDCEKLRQAQLLTIPCVKLSKGKSSGTLLNGSYQVAIAYTVNQIRATDYLILSEVQGLFTHQNASSSLELAISNTDTDFDELEVAIISTVNQQTVAKRLGIYSTGQGTIYIDTIDPSLPVIPLNIIPLQTPSIEKSDATFNVGSYLIRLGVYTRPDFNYQPQANKIATKWVSVRYPKDYYVKGGHNASYMRDEQYAFFIRWIYNTGDKSASYHIPGRNIRSGNGETVTGQDAFEAASGSLTRKWQVYNTATKTASLSTEMPDGGVITAEGDMGYWESTEIYPDDQPFIWGINCGRKIRHHKFPDNTTADEANHFTQGGEYINILGVKFENITHPLDSNDNPIASIVGYEILRGSREGQKTIIAKGLFNNLRQYDIPGDTQKGLFQNYPYNDLRPDRFLTTDRNILKKGGTSPGESPMTAYRKDIFSFHSPETNFSKPFLSANEVRIYQQQTGTTTGSFTVPHKHPKFKALTNFTSVLGSIAGLMSAGGVISNGVQIGATDDLPITMQVGPVAGPPSPPTGSGSVFTVAQGVLAYISYAASLAVWIASIAQVVTMSKLIADATKEKVLTLFYALAPKIQYTLQYTSHGAYDKFSGVEIGNTRRFIKNSNYVDGNIQSFSNYKINNLYRGNFVAVEIDNQLTDPSSQDTSRALISEANVDTETTFNTKISSYYGALKISLPSQYGQIDSIRQVPIGSCILPTNGIKNQQLSTPVLFGGDTYINRYTEKNTMFFFNDWLYDFPDDFEYDYRKYANVPYPRFWMDSSRLNNTLLSVASDYRRLDKLNTDNSGWKNPFFVKGGYFYLFNSGVKDFFVESEVNLAQRDWDDTESKRHYDPYGYTDLNSMFRSDIIRSGNFYKYDYSLSNSKLFNSYISWGGVLGRDYNPQVSEKCYSYYPKRLIYSLPQELELKKDNWLSFLPNNYKDMPSHVTSIKTINKSGAMIMMRNQGPIQFMGVDNLQTDGGIKVTVGDGGLFNQPLQTVVNSDRELQYGSCQNKQSVISTPYGVFYVSQQQGKIFNYSGQLEEISRLGNKWWFSQYLPSVLLNKFPSYLLFDNPVKGIACQAVYDNTNEIIYFTKKDYKPLSADIKLDEDNIRFYILVGGTTRQYIELTDTNYFESSSWTISFDPKNKVWISYHDWHPDYIIPGMNHFNTVKDNSIWKHNIGCGTYCNFYGKDYPFEVEFISSTGQQVTTIKSIEYILESYRYYNDCHDKFQVLDHNFDRAIVYNSEQVSGVLKLNLTSKTNPTADLKYPVFGTNLVDILYSKEESKFRFNQFYDITKDRGEFNDVSRPMFNTMSNGYISIINPNYISYQKESLQLKKFRSYTNRVFLRKIVSGDVKMIFKLNNIKNLISQR